MQNQQMQAQQHIGPSGMVHQTPETPQPDTPNVPDFDDPEVQKQWRKKLANDPIRGMREFVQMMIQAEGTPMLEQFRNDVMSQLQPVQQAYVQQSVNAYKQSRFQSDPNFTQVAPHFDQVLNQALRERPNLQLDANTMSTLEHIARLQAQQTPNFAPQGGYGQPQPPQPPFTERPGSAQHRAQKQQASTPQLTPAQKRMARTFNMTEQQYAAKLQEMNR